MARFKAIDLSSPGVVFKVSEELSPSKSVNALYRRSLGQRATCFMKNHTKTMGSSHTQRTQKAGTNSASITHVSKTEPQQI